MGYSNQQIGWSQEAILLQKILKQLVRLTEVTAASVNPVVITTTTTTTEVPTTTTTTTL